MKLCMIKYNSYDHSSLVYFFITEFLYQRNFEFKCYAML